MKGTSWLAVASAVLLAVAGRAGAQAPPLPAKPGQAAPPAPVTQIPAPIAPIPAPPAVPGPVVPAPASPAVTGPSPAAKPDLVVASARVKLGAACEPRAPILTVTAEVRNVGKGSSPARGDVGVVGAEDADGSGWGNGTGLPALAPGAGTTVTFPVYYLAADPGHMVGTHRFQVTVNRGHWIDEADLSNNAYGPVTVVVPPGFCKAPGAPVDRTAGGGTSGGATPAGGAASPGGATSSGGATPSDTGKPSGTATPASPEVPPVQAPDSGGVATAAPAATASPPAAPSTGDLFDRPLPTPPAAPTTAARDPNAIEAGEVVALSASMDRARDLEQQARGLGFTVLRRRSLPALGLVVTVFRIPAGTTVEQALTTLRRAVPDLWTDANHRYGLQGGGGGPARLYATTLVRWGPVSGACGTGMRIGIVDTPVDVRHAALRTRRLTARSFLPAGVAPAPAGHATAVAALLVGDADQAAFAGLLPGADLYLAAVFRVRDGARVDTTAEWVALALDWLVGQQVSVVNLSLGGPRNLVLEAAVRRTLERGVAAVAAAGNGGGAAPVYPAAQPGVLAVTAVDAELRPDPRASRGDHIALAAPGVDVWVAAPGEGGAYASGTSYAAPFVTAALAALRAARPDAPWAELRERLERGARELGPPGKDPVFGWGLLQAPVTCAQAAGLDKK